MTAPVAIGIDIGGTKIAAGTVDADGHVSQNAVIPTPAHAGPEAVVAAVRSLAATLLDQHPTAAVGVGTAGTVGANGEIVFATDAVHDWAGFPLRTALENAWGRPVLVLNDVHAAAVAEARVGAGAGWSSFLAVTVGTGVGGAGWRDGALLPSIGGIAGSIGHMVIDFTSDRRCPCGGRGHVEAYASGPAIEADYRRKAHRHIPLREIANRAAAGDPAAVGSIDRGAQALGAGIAAAAALLEPEGVVIGGGVASIGAPYLDAVRRAIASMALPALRSLDVRPAATKDFAGVVGAAFAARDSRANRPGIDRA